MRVFTKEKIEKVLVEYLNNEEPNYSGIRLFYRRLSQIGITQAIEFSIKNMDKLIQAISDLAQYLISVANISNQDLHEIGDDMYKLLDNKLIVSNEFLQISLLSMFAHSSRFNHLDKLIKMYRKSSGNVKRKIIIAAYSADAGE